MGSSAAGPRGRLRIEFPSRPRRPNIIFGLQMLPVDTIRKLPSETIVYNFEQMRNVKAADIVPQLHLAAERLRIWEYSEGNVEGWRALGAKNVFVAPVSYAPILQRIPRAPTQDIDVLIYGMPGKDRLDAFHYIAHSGLTTVFVAGLYGKARDDLIARSKTIVNINLYEPCRSSSLFVCPICWQTARQSSPILLPIPLSTTTCASPSRDRHRPSSSMIV